MGTVPQEPSPIFVKIDISENLCYNILRAFIQARERRA